MEPQGIQITVFYGARQAFGRWGNAARRVHVLGRVTAEAGLHALYYTLNQRPRPTPLPVGPSAFRLQDPGDFNIEIPREDLLPGLNTVAITAIDRRGRHATGNVTIQWVPDQTWPLPFEARWADAANPQELAEVIDGVWQIERGGLRTLRAGYDRMVAIGDVTWCDYDITVPVTVHRIDDAPTVYRWPSGGASVGIKVGYQGHQDWGDVAPPRGWFPIGCHAQLKHETGMRPGHVKRRIMGSGFIGPLAQEPSTWPIEVGAVYVFRVAVRSMPGLPNEYRMKVWPRDAAEPDGWDLIATGTDDEQKTGSAVLLAHHMDVTFGDAVVRPYS